MKHDHVYIIDKYHTQEPFVKHDHSSCNGKATWFDHLYPLTMSGAHRLAVTIGLVMLNQPF